jgi:hypothetical protein
MTFGSPNRRKPAACATSKRERAAPLFFFVAHAATLRVLRCSARCQLASAFDVARAAGLRVRRINAATRSLELQAMLVASRDTFILRAARSVPCAAHSFCKLADSDLQKAGNEFLNGRLHHFIEHAIVINATADTENAYFGAVLLTTRLIGPDDFARRSFTSCPVCRQ